MTLGKLKTRSDKLMSIIPQMEFNHQVNQWAVKGVPFKTHLYVPEKHPVTQTQFHEREDEGHVFKVYAIEICIIAVWLSL